MKAASNSKIESLFTAIQALESSDEARRFFRDLLTEKELAEFANRWQAAQMLDRQISYTKIQQATGLSSTTVARIAKWLTAGMGGYRLIIDRLANHHHTSSESSRLTEA